MPIDRERLPKITIFDGQLRRARSWAIGAFSKV